MAPFQIKFILDVYDNPYKTTMAILSMARKNAKTALIAFLVLAHTAGPEARQNSSIISGAMSRKQAGMVFQYAAETVRLSAELSSRCKITDSAKRIVGLSKNVTFEAISAQDTTAHGLSPVLAILDEVGQVRGPNSKFVDAIITSQGAHGSNAIRIAISTQAATDADLLSIWIDDAKKGADPQIICHVYCADESAELLDERQWHKANPALEAGFRDFNELKTSAEKAERMPSFENTFRNLYLNQRVELFDPFLSKGVWLLNSGEVDREVFMKYPVYAGLDLSAKLDLTAFVMICNDGNKWHVWPLFWTPSKGLADRVSRDRAPYDEFARQGHLRVLEGAAIDYEHVLTEVAETVEGMNVQAVAFDRWRMDVLKKDAERLGISLPFVEFGQGFKDMSPALELLEEDFANEKMAHGMNPVLTMCAANAVVERDSANNRKLSKNKSSGRIDGMQALAMARGSAGKTVEYQDLFANGPLTVG